MIVDVTVHHKARLEFEVYSKYENPFEYWARCTNSGGIHLVVGPAKSPFDLGEMVEQRLLREFEYLEKWVNVPALSKSIVASAGNIPTDPPVK